MNNIYFETATPCSSQNLSESFVDYSDIKLRKSSFLKAPIDFKTHGNELAEKGFFFKKPFVIKCFLCQEKVECIDHLSYISERHEKNCQFYQNSKELKKNIVNFISLSSVEKENSSLEKIQCKVDRLKKEWICPQCNCENRNVLFFPCRHIGACSSCSNLMQYCSDCQTKISGTMEIYKA